MPPRRTASGIRDGLVKGVTSVAIESTLQKSGVDALMGSIITLGSAGAVEGLLEGQGLFKGAFDAYFSSSKGLLTLGGPGSTSSDQAVYLSKVIDFSQITQRDGFGAAFSTYASSIFHSQTIENIWKAGGIYDLLAKNAEVVVNAQGETVKRVYTNKNDRLHSEYIDISLSTDELVGYKEVLVDVVIVTDCVYQVGPDGKVQAKDEIKTLTFNDGRKEIYTVQNHYLTSIQKTDPAGSLSVWITTTEPGTGIEINPDNSIKTGRLIDIQTSMTLDIKDNQISRVFFSEMSPLSSADILKILNSGLENPYVRNARLVFSADDFGNVKVETIAGADAAGIGGTLPRLQMISGNGIANPMPENVPPAYEAQYKRLLVNEGANPNNIYLLPLYENGNPIIDSLSWIFDAFTSKTVTQEVKNKLDTFFSSPFVDHSKPMTAVLYSGAFNPFMMALGDRPDYNIDTIVSLGGPSIIGTIAKGTITNPNIKQIYNIYGSEDGIPLAGLNKSFTGTNVININILGAGHMDYFYKPSTNSGSMNDKSSLFIEQLTAAISTKDQTKVSSILTRPGIKYDLANNMYTVDVRNESFAAHN